MKEFLAGVRRWYRRRFRGIVAPPRQYGGQGTTWQQHHRLEVAFICGNRRPRSGRDVLICEQELEFTAADYVIRSQDHIEGCEGITDRSTGNPAKSTSKVLDMQPCSCPVTDARYVKICPQCRLGHWKDASK